VFDYIFLISGQDYPIKSQNIIYDFFENNYGKSFLSFTTMPVQGWNWGPDGGMDRLSHYFIRFGKMRWVYPPFEKPKGTRPIMANYFSKIFYRLPRNHPNDLKPFAGSTWLNLHRATAEYILNFVNRRPDFVKFHKYTAIVDETFFQTILGNGPDSITSNLVNNDLRFIDWSRKNENKGHPEILTLQHKDEIMKSDAHFARKFEPEIDTSILDFIDNNILYCGRR